MDKTEALAVETGLQSIDVFNVETWREYDFNGRVYRIEAPAEILFRPGGVTHRVVDADGVCHIVPAPGHFGCVVRCSGPVNA